MCLEKIQLQEHSEFYRQTTFLFAGRLGYENRQGAGGKAGSVITRGSEHTHDNLSASFICFILYALPLGCLPDEVNTLVPWLSEINLTEDFCAGPFGAARLWGLEERSSCPSLNDKLVINCETTAASLTRVFVTL